MNETDPSSIEVKIDRANAFLLYATFCGDVVRTAAAIGVRPAVVLQMADEEHWAEQLKPILELKKSAKPGDIERAINRALNFVQANRMRMFIERVVHRLTGMEAHEFEQYLFTETHHKNGDVTQKLTTRAIADLASAMEKAHALTYMALNDTGQERVKRKEEDHSGSASDMHLEIAKAMSEIRKSSTPRALLFDAQLSAAQDIVAENTRPVNPHDNDDH